jgi:hypothetical protein
MALAAGVRAWLVQLRQEPTRPPRTRTAQRARDLGYATQEVQYQGRFMSPRQAEDLDPNWWQSAEYTGRDRITDEGLRALREPG